MPSRRCRPTGNITGRPGSPRRNFRAQAGRVRRTTMHAHRFASRGAARCAPRSHARPPGGAARRATSRAGPVPRAETSGRRRREFTAQRRTPRGSPVGALLAAPLGATHVLPPMPPDGQHRWELCHRVECGGSPPLFAAGACPSVLHARATCAPCLEREPTGVWRRKERRWKRGPSGPRKAGHNDRALAPAL